MHVVVVAFANSAEIDFQSFSLKKVGEGVGSAQGDIDINAVNSPSLCLELFAQMPGTREEV